MKLNLYIQKLLREIICKKGRQKTLDLFKIERTTLYKWENNSKYTFKNIINLDVICIKYCEVFPKEDLKEVLMQGLHFYLEDILKEKV
jgi:DNA-binding XRE family transcriptional regulator